MTYKGLSGFLAGSRGGASWVSQAVWRALIIVVSVKTEAVCVLILIYVFQLHLFYHLSLLVCINY